MKARHSIESLPLLMRGKHRSPRRGACFMEFASYLAGERWSDHPSCTHPRLASLARQVNDRVSDEVRQTMVQLVPDVVGLTSSDLRSDVVIALRAATDALPVVSEDRQRVMALAILLCERLLADLEGQPGRPLSARSTRVLAGAPAAAAWARRNASKSGPSRRVFRRQTAQAVIDFAVDGIWQACIPDNDQRLRDLLAGAIDDCRPYCAPPREPLPSGRDRWAEPVRSAAG